MKGRGQQSSAHNSTSPVSKPICDGIEPTSGFAANPLRDSVVPTPAAGETHVASADSTCNRPLRDIGRRVTMRQGGRAARRHAQVSQPCQQAHLRWNRTDKRVCAEEAAYVAARRCRADTRGGGQECRTWLSRQLLEPAPACHCASRVLRDRSMAGGERQPSCTHKNCRRYIDPICVGSEPVKKL